MVKIMFVCHGNICRSPMAEFVMKKIVKERGLQDKIAVFSSATSTDEIGSNVHHGTRGKLTEKGVEFTDRRAVRLEKSDYNKYDFFIGMDIYNVHNMLKIFGGDPEHKIFRTLELKDNPADVADPWYTGDFEQTYIDVLSGCESWIDFIVNKKMYQI